MPNSDLLIGFFIATAIFSYVPGPAMLYATAQTIARGRQAGWMAALGIHVGGYAHVLAAALGLAVLFKAVPTIYMALKLAGALYLIWLGIRLFFSTGEQSAETLNIGSKSARATFWESVTVEVLNPKTAVFFLAFLPQFADANAAWPLSVQLLILGTIVNVMFSTADLLCVALAGAIAQRLKTSSAVGRLSRKVGGTVLVGLGIHLATSRG